MLLAILVTATSPAPAHASDLNEVRITHDLPYGTDQHGGQLLLDVYQPLTATSPNPIVILIHGGGWVAGDKAQYEPFARALARAGFLIFDINYSLDPSQSPAFPRQVTDVQTALAWVRSHAEAFNGDNSRIGVAGGSAGGYLAAMLGTQADTDGTEPVRAVVSLSAPMDLVAAVAELRQAATSASGQCAPPACADVELARARLLGLLGCDPLQCPEELLREASPITYVTSASPPFFLANSTTELIPAGQAQSMAAALQAHDVPVDLTLVPGAEHAVAYVPTIRSQLLEFLTVHVMGDLPAADGTVTNRSQEPRRGTGALRWLVGAAAICLLVVLAVARRRRASSETGAGDLLGRSTRTHERR